MDLFLEDLKLPVSERYLQSIMATESMKLAVTMVPSLAPLFHKVSTIEVDSTFKRTIPGMDEWEITGWIPEIKRRMLPSTKMQIIITDYNLPSCYAWSHVL